MNLARRIVAAESALAGRLPWLPSEQRERIVRTILWRVGQSWSDAVADLTVSPGDDILVYKLVGIEPDPIRERDHVIASAWLADRRKCRP